MFDVPQDVPPVQHKHIHVAAQDVISGGGEYLYEVHNEPQKMGFIKPKPKQHLAYHQLKCTSDDQYTIGTIIAWMGEHGKLWLLANKSKMSRMGDSIRHVHPLKFLEIVFTDDYLKDCMEKIFDDYFKRNGFMDGLASSLEAKSQTGELDRHIPHFASAVEISEEALRPFFDKRAWEDLVRYLIYN